jgi:hypothetical protein
MKINSFLRTFFFLAFSICLANTDATTNASAKVKLPSKKNFHIYLLMGQSNMAGRGNIEAEDKTPHPRVYFFTSNRWEIAVDPIHRDRKSGLGVGPGLNFGKVLADKFSGATIGLVPCAVGGTPLVRWSRGGDLYSNALQRATIAIRDGTLKGIIWHQGENDSQREEDANTYGQRLAKMIKDIREDLGAKDLPFVVGQIGEFLYTRDKSPFARKINEALAKIPEIVPHTGCALSKDLNHKGDGVHFDSASERELGRRYAAEMIRLQNDK